MNLFEKKHAWILGGFEYLHVDNVTANAGSGGATFASDDIGGVQYPRAKVVWGADGSANDTSAANPLPVVQTGTPALPTGAATEATLSAASAKLPATLGQKAMAASMAVTIASDQSTIPMSDAGGSVTTDSAQLPATLGQKAMAASLAVVIASDQGNIGVSDGGTSLTTDFSGQKTLDYDTGAGTDTVLGVGILLPASGGAVAGGTATNPVRTDPTGTTTQPVSLASVPSHAVTNAGTFATQESGAALTALQLIDDVVLAEDAAHVSGDKGVMALAVRKDVAAALAGTDGDYIPLTTDSTGALRVTGGGGGTQYQEDAAHASGDTGTLALAVRRDANTTMVSADGDYSPLQTDANGGLKVSIIAGAGSGGTSATDDAAFTVAAGSGTPIMGLADETAPDSVDEGDVGVVRMTLARALHVNLRDASGNELSAGAQYAEDAAHTTGDLGTLALVVRKDTAAQVAGTDGDYSALVNDASGRLHVNVGALPSGTVAGGSSLPAGTNNIGDVDVLTVPTDPFGANADAASASGSISAKLRFIASTGIPITGTVTVGSHAVTNAGTFAVQAAQSGTWTVQPGNTQNTTAWLVTDVPATSGGWTSSITLSAATTNATSVKASAGQVGGWYLYNANAAVRYFKLYNKATAPTVGTDTPVMVIPIPPGSAANVEFGKGIAFATGIAFAITAGVANSDTTVVAANEIVVNLFYK